MYKALITILLIAGCAGCAQHTPKEHAAVALTPVDSQVEQLADPSITSASLAAVMPQFSRGAPPVMVSLQPIYSMQKALPNVQKVSRKPVVAMTQYRNW